jgi:hypothetical protein
VGSAPRDGRVTVPEDVLVQRLPDDESVFLNLATEQYYGLDPTGTAMWAALTETGSVAAALERLAGEFDVDREVLSRDLDALVERLVGRGLIVVTDDSVPADNADVEG